MKNLIIKWDTSINEISQESWENVSSNNSIPFFQHSWLLALETSGSITPKKGWQPLYLSIWRHNDLLGVAPLFLKNHSYGEFIFDHSFVQLANKLNIEYYPKLIGMSPVSPVEGYRFLISDDESQIELTNLMINEIDKFCIRNNILSCNFLYVDQNWKSHAEAAKCATWINQKSLWYSSRMKNFSDYLSNFNANQRRNIKRERQYLKKLNIKVSIATGSEVNLKDMQEMHCFYKQHCERWGIWGSKYLSESFFEKLSSKEHRDKVVLFKANKENNPKTTAMSLCITNGSTLWGRYWGSKEDIDYLHFELCYYSPIEWALSKGIKSFDPGSGGNHKLRRGFLAEPHSSLHRWYEPTINQIIREWLPKANDLTLREIDSINNGLPLKIKKPPFSNND
tara:strand:+ start:14693 stop:15877 length:1185 start_codon:yes stop_codon:yes gene_type:complete